MAARGHVCPQSNAIHPSDRWESLFIYSFICKFTKLRGKVEGLETPMDADQLSSTVSSVLADAFKGSERTVFWDEDLKMNVDPFQQLEGGFWSASWNLKLKILRQLVELQLTHSPEIKGKIDRAWGVHHNKNKKKDSPTAPPPPEDPESQQNLQLLPLGQDISRKRYWAADLSPRIYVSTNPWKITATLQTISSTREEYVSVIEQLKANAPPPAKTKKKRPRPEIAHEQLIKSLEERLEDIDKELVVSVYSYHPRKKEHAIALHSLQCLLLLVEEDQTAHEHTFPSGRQTRKPDYVYANGGIDSEDEVDEYRQTEGDYEDDFEDPDAFDEDTGRPRRSTRAAHAVGQRRSTRTAVLNANGKREAAEDPYHNWRGERRSARLGAPPEFQLDFDPPPKRARTEDSSMATSSSPGPSDSMSPTPDPDTRQPSVKVKTTGAAALKPTEVAMEELVGKKRSKFWVYAVEPMPGAAPAEDSNDMMVDDDHSHANGKITSPNGCPPDRCTTSQISTPG
ncbi:hypothetical protein AAF712_004388 [Marasmius tenuissimus]|uniref:WHIM1 domain-containing protein n=1 Tax=Marasmius tenuissimus TaxID=585030 RepID=A0ABR3A3X0_9AGAR